VLIPVLSKRPACHCALVGQPWLRFAEHFCRAIGRAWPTGTTASIYDADGFRHGLISLALTLLICPR